MVLPEFFDKFVNYWFLGGLGDLENLDLEARLGPKRARNAKKWIFPVLGDVLGNAPRPNLIAC